jgi:CheY-like chemotaxis protein
MDIQLPGMSGFDAILQLKKDPVTMNIPVIALTAFAMKGDEQRILGAGCDDYIAKPFDYRDLLTRVEAIIGDAKELIEP